MEMEKREKEKDKDKERRRAVPKFGSFKPKPASESTPETRPRPVVEETRANRDGLGRAEKDSRNRDRGGRGEHGQRHSSREQRLDRERTRERGREGGKDWDGERDRDRERARHRDGTRDRGRDHGHEREGKRENDSREERNRARLERYPSRPRSPKTASGRNKSDRTDPSLLSNDLFVIDKRGDPLIEQYGSNDRSQIPVYRRFGGGRIIGSPGFLTIHRDGGQEKFSIRLPGEGSGSGSAFRDKALVTAAARLASKRIKPSTDPALPIASSSEDFIPLAPSRKRKRDDHDENDNNPPPPDYRSIYGKAAPTNPSDPDSDSDTSRSRSRSPSPSPEPDLPTPQARAAHLSRHVKAHPSDIPAWVDLVALQDTLFPSQGSSSSSPRTADEVRSLAALKLALYQESLPHAVSPRDREGLVLGMMREGGRVWGEEALRRRWAEVASEGCGFGLWRARLDFEMGRVAGFGLEEVRGMVVGKLKGLGEALGRVVSGLDEGGEEVEELCRQVVYVFLRLTRLLHDAGFAELAVAAWQALLEMTFCRPPGEHTAELALALFAEYWESEVARIGEDGAKGWRRFVEAGEDMVDPPEGGSDRPSEVPRTTDPIRAWAAVEQQGAEKARMPARTLDEGTEDDPFRVVMFSDIKELLVWCPSAVLLRVKPLLADAFLVFCGLPPACLSGEEFLALLNDPFVAATSQGLDLGLNKDDSGSAQDLTRQTPEFIQQGGNLAISPDVLFSENPKFRYFDKWSNTHQPGEDQVDVSWVLRTLGFLVKDCGMEMLAEYYLAMEWVNEPTRAKKVAKGLLKQYSSNIRLYNAYSLAEWANGAAEVSHKVLSSATGLAVPSSPNNQLLWSTWAWVYIASDQKELALARLCSSVDKEFEDSTPSPALLLKARSHFSSARDYSLSSQQLGAAAQYAESLMLLEYLAAEGGSEPASKTQGNITAALSTIHTFSQDLESRNQHNSSHHERLLQTAARLLYHHATRGPYRPTYLSAQLQPFLRLFPHNTLFLSLFAWCQPPLRIDDPVRAVLLLQQSRSLPDHGLPLLGTHRFAIHHEARVGTAHSVRAAFEAALESGEGGCRGSAELWVRYIRFCCSRRKELKGRAREVFYRAIGACPGAKEVYMEAFGPGMAGVLSVSELRAVVETMVEKGLRVHVDLGEFLERWGR